MKSQKLRKSKLFLLSIFLVVPALFYRFGEHWLHLILLYLSGAAWARNFVSSLPVAQHVSARFVAGETVDDAIDAARTMNAMGMSATMDYLGESITTTADAIAAKDEILRLLDKIQEHGIDANVSVKLSQLGLKINQDLVLDNMRQILIRAVHNHNKVRIDMEESAVTQATLDIYRTLRDQDGFGRNVGIVIQSYLYRSKPDVQQLVEDGAWVRLCKGAYAEPQEVAFADKSDTDSNYVQLTKMMLNKNALEKGVYLGVATHDEAIIHSTINHIQSIAFPKDNFEFQMLYGIRRDLQESLVKDGYRMRIYIPYGTAWYPYFMRRLAERPANLWFFISNFFRN